jgi:hypothetical protein
MTVLQQPDDEVGALQARRAPPSRLIRVFDRREGARSPGKG